MAERRARVRAEILEAARDLVAEVGLTGLSLRDLAARVGMRAPSLYSYFDSKDAIYDALFAEGYEALLERRRTLWPSGEDLPPRQRLKVGAGMFFDFCTEDPARYLLMFQRTIPGWEPSPEAYAVSVAALEEAGRYLTEAGIADEAGLDLWTALLTGLADQQLSNDPGGDRWRRLLDDAVDMYCDHLGL